MKRARFVYKRLPKMSNPQPAEKFSSPGARRFLPTGLAIALHLAVVLPLAARLNIWLDEAWTMQTTARGFSFAWREAIVAEHQAPLYFAFMSLWRALDDSLFFARFFSTLCIAATIALLPALLKRFAPRAGENDSRGLQILLPFVFAVHPYSIWASLEARVYALLIFLSALLLLVWFDAYAAPPSENNRKKTQAFYVLLAAVALYTNYYLGFLLFANACALLALRRWKTFAVYVAQMSAVGLVFLPLVFAVKQQFDVNADYFREPVPFVETVKLVWSVSNQFLLPSAEWDAIAFWRVLAARLAALALFFLIVRNFRRIEPPTFALAVVAAVVAAFLMTAYFLMGIEYAQLRHCAAFFVPLVLFAAVLIANLSVRRGWLVWLALFLIFAPTRLYSEYAPLKKNGDWSRVAEFIAQNEAENEPIATFQIHDAIPLGYVYHGKNPILRAEPLDDIAPEDKPLSPDRWRRQIEKLLAEIPANQERFWLVTESYCGDEIKSIECEPLENFARENYTVEKSADFYMRRVRLLRRK